MKQKLGNHILCMWKIQQRIEWSDYIVGIDIKHH